MLISASGLSTPLDPVPLGGRDTTEDWLQERLDAHPELLPIDEIGAAWGPLVSLGHELELDRGLIDNLFVSPTGELTVVEAKLWRNPEARRKVIGQILDYAAELATLTYEQLDEIVRSADAANRSTWQRVIASPCAPDPAMEHQFVDVVSNNLRAGRFLLLVVGDGIRSDLLSLASLLGSHASLGFHLELVEMRMFRMPDDAGLLVMPSLVGRTVESVARAVVEVRSNGPVDVDVVIDIPGVVESDGRTKFSSVDEFLATVKAASGAPKAKALGDLLAWWDAKGGVTKLNKRSLNLSVPYPYRPGGSISVMTIYANLWVQGSVAPMVEWREIISLDDALPRFEAAGFVPSDPLWPRLDDLDLTQSDQRARLERLLVWADETIRAAAV